MYLQRSVLLFVSSSLPASPYVPQTLSTPPDLYGAKLADKRTQSLLRQVCFWEYKFVF